MARADGCDHQAAGGAADRDAEVGEGDEEAVAELRGVLGVPGQPGLADDESSRVDRAPQEHGEDGRDGPRADGAEEGVEQRVEDGEGGHRPDRVAFQQPTEEEVAEDHHDPEGHQQRTDRRSAQVRDAFQVLGEVAVDREHGREDEHHGRQGQPQPGTVQNAQLVSVGEPLGGRHGREEGQDPDQGEQVGAGAEPERGREGEMFGKVGGDRDAEGKAQRHPGEDCGGGPGGPLLRHEPGGGGERHREEHRMEERRHDPEDEHHREAVGERVDGIGGREHRERRRQDGLAPHPGGQQRRERPGHRDHQREHPHQPPGRRRRHVEFLGDPGQDADDAHLRGDDAEHPQGEGQDNRTGLSHDCLPPSGRARARLRRPAGPSYKSR